MYTILPIGSVVKLHNGERKMMVICRAPKYVHNEKEYYVDYSGCLYPDGQYSENVFFFNHEDVEEVIYKGYVDDMERFYEDQYHIEIAKIQLKKYILNDK